VRLKIIYLLGTDGAGKTTVARQLAASPIAGQRIAYLYCGGTPKLLYPLKLAAQRFFLRKASPYGNYSTYVANKQGARRRRPCLAAIYCGVWYIDFLIQAWVSLCRPWLRRATVIVDRYYLDNVVDQSVFRETDLSGMLRDARRLERLLPMARLHVFLDVAEDTAFARKNDIPSVDYLRPRRARYLALAPHYQFISVDANQPVEAVCEQTRKVIAARLPSL
jgi:dTMP kinase